MATDNKKPNTGKKAKTFLNSDEVRMVLDATLSHPSNGLAKTGKQFGLGGSTINGWLVPQPSRGGVLKPEVREWFKEHGREFRELRPQIKLCPELLAISGSEEGMIGPLDIGPAPVAKPTRYYPTLRAKRLSQALEFTPQTTGDLIVLKTDIDDLVEQAEQAIADLTGIRDALAMVMAWQSDSSELAKAKAKIAELEHQVRLADKKTETERSKFLSDRLVEIFERK